MNLQSIQKNLSRELDEVRLALLRYIEKRNSSLSSYDLSGASQWSTDVETPLSSMVAHFGLSPFEKAILLLCAGVELETSFVGLCADANGDPLRGYPTFSLALVSLPSPHWSAISPEGALRKYQLIRVEPGGLLTTCPLRIEERVLHALVGLSFVDEKLAKYGSFLEGNEQEVESYQEPQERIVRAWRQDLSLPVVLYGSTAERRRQFAISFCREHSLSLFEIQLSSLPVMLSEVSSLQERWFREMGLRKCVLLLENDTEGDPARDQIFRWWLERSEGALLLSCERHTPSISRSVLQIEIPQSTERERQTLWEERLQSIWPESATELSRALSYQFSMSETNVDAICNELERVSSEQEPPTQKLWELCRSQTRGQLEALAQRMNSSVSWEDLVLPASHMQTLRQIAAQMKQRYRVYQEWGFGKNMPTGLGVNALFAGASGTGKTFAAQVLSNELSLDLYRIDLSSVVSKYIGETEKNLKRLFDAAETSGAILLFDEADALFGKRSEVKDSHDRHANIEVSYLLQRIETYRGLAILTTNMKEALDVAFLRRIRFIVSFPFPDVTQRTDLWKKSFPPQAPTEGLDFNKLARWNVSGGSIRNIAMNAAFLAAEKGSAIQVEHLIAAAESEYIKLEKPFTEAEVRGLR